MSDAAKKKRTILVTLVLMLTLVFTCTIQVNAASKKPKAPGQVVKLKTTPVSECVVEMNWKASNYRDTIAGYAIYRDGKKIGEVKNKYTTNFRDTNLAAAHTYKYKVRAFKTYKEKQKKYYNSKKKKWVSKKPKVGQWKGKKTRTVKVAKRVYGKYSMASVATTKPAVAYPDLATARIRILAAYNALNEHFFTNKTPSKPEFDDVLNLVAQEMAEDLAARGGFDREKYHNDYYSTVFDIDKTIRERGKTDVIDLISVYTYAGSVFDEAMIRRAAKQDQEDEDTLGNWGDSGWTQIGIGYCRGWVQIILAYPKVS